VRKVGLSWRFTAPAFETSLIVAVFEPRSRVFQPQVTACVPLSIGMCQVGRAGHAVLGGSALTRFSALATYSCRMGCDLEETFGGSQRFLLTSEAVVA
jgi:hypothetical protein